MPRKSKKQADVEAHEREVLQSKVRIDGAGEDPVVRDLLSPKFVEGTNADALNIALALQQVLKGNAALLENQDKFSEHLAKLQERMEKMDASARKWEEDRQRYIDDVTRMANKLKVTEAQQEKMKAEAALDLQKKITEARASITIDRKMFDAALAREPKVIVTSGGVTEMVHENGAIVAKLYPEEIRIKHRRWILYPGRPTEVPQSVAIMLEGRRQSQMETAERQQAMAKNMESGELAQRMKEIDEKYKSTTAHLGESEPLL